MDHGFRSALAGIPLALAFTLSGCAAPRDQRSATQAAQAIVHDTSIALQNVLEEGDRPGLRTALHCACAVLVFPHMRGGSFLAGWSGGAGVLMVRDRDQVHWLGPTFFSLGDMTIGPEVALSTWELVVVFKSCDVLGPLKEGARTFSFRTSLARQSAEDDAGLAVGPDIRAFAHTQGGAVGLSLHFVELQSEERLTAASHGRALPAGQAPPGEVQQGGPVWALRRTMERVTK